MLRLFALLLVLAFLQLPSAAAGPQEHEDHVGDIYQIRLQSTLETTGDGSSGSSRSSWALEERVMSVRGDGVELEFDLPSDASREDRARNWQFPARVLASPDGRLQLLNSSELETRLRSWLQLGGFTEAACGQWIFTWTAFKIECDPESVLDVLTPANLRLNLREGALYDEPAAREPVRLREDPQSSDSRVLIAEMEIDPEFVRRDRADSAVVVAQMMREPITLETALQEWQRRQISGTITSTFVRDASSRVIATTRIARITVIDESGSEERRTSTTTVERRLLSR